MKTIAKRCTGCGACYNACPNNAIIMKEDEEGFLYPEVLEENCIHCGECEKICPVLHPSYRNLKNAECYAMMASDEKRLESSSGAFVPLLAEWVLKQRGIVYGAAWREDWSVHHIKVDSINGLSQIKGTKYLQSDTEMCYRDVKEQLEQGKIVLFTGTPCEIAGLYAFLNGTRVDENLITIDVICHGVPSHKVFSKYLYDNYDVSDVENINFRDKSVLGWSNSQNIYFKTKKTVRKNEIRDSYYQGYLPCLFMRPACSTCPFSCMPRQGDITVGDFWGAKELDKKFDDKKGTSVVIVNNVKGEKIVKNISSNMKLWEKVSISAITKVNESLLHPLNGHSGRKHFFSTFNLKKFNELVKASLEHHYDIGIVGLWYGINYGSVLTYYALYSLIRDLGYDPVMLPRPNLLWKEVEERFDDMESIAQKFIWKHCNVFLKCRCQEEYTRFNDRCDDFVLGSDVVWKYSICGRDTDQFFFLDWVEEGHRKIAYASSFGNGLDGTEEYKTKARHYINQFDAVSVRESYGASVVKKECGREEVEQVLDPVFVCNSDIYYEAIKESKLKINNKFIFVYMLTRHDATQRKKVILDVAKHENAEVVLCGNPNQAEGSAAYNIAIQQTLEIEDWLYYMKNCSFYIGDSYHGLCFALIFHKPFLILIKTGKINTSEQRFYSLLRIVGLEERCVTNLDDASKIRRLYEKDIDWDYVDECLEKNKMKSLKWLKEALVKDRKQLEARKCIEDSYIRTMNDKVAELKQQLAKQQSIIAELSDKQKEEKHIKDSLSYKIGRSVTWIPRKVRRILKR